MPVAQRPGLPEDRAMAVPFTVEQYHRMISTGILREGEPIELVDGFLVRKDRSSQGANPMTVGPAHALVLAKLAAALGGLEPHGCHFRPQSPITIEPDSEPEPDGAIVRGLPDNYPDRQPAPTDVCCVIEVSDSSLAFDRTTKLRLYADAGIARYLVFNLIHHMIEDYEQPLVGQGRYERLTVHHRDSTIRLPLPDGSSRDLTVERLIP